MRVANIIQGFAIKVIPTLLRFGLASDMFEQDGKKVCTINYDVLCEKFKVVQDVEGVETEIEKSFESPVVFDTNKKTIPYALYLLIENYRMTKDETLLANINNALKSFKFENSLSDFELQVSDIF